MKNYFLYFSISLFTICFAQPASAIFIRFGAECHQCVQCDPGAGICNYTITSLEDGIAVVTNYTSSGGILTLTFSMDELTTSNADQASYFSGLSTGVNLTWESGFIFDDETTYAELGLTGHLTVPDNTNFVIQRWTEGGVNKASITFSGISLEN